MDVHVSLVGRRDLAGEIYRQLRAAILERRLLAGQALPPTRELAVRLSVSRTTVTVAYDRLIGEGFAVARVGSGTYVARNTRTGRHRRPPPSDGLRAQPSWDAIPVPAVLWSETRFDLRSGIPDARRFPFATWRRLLARQFRPIAAGTFAYGEPSGHPALRAAISRYFGGSRGVRSAPEDVLITNGTQQAIDLVARVLLRQGDRVAVEDPSYGPPRRLFAAVGMRVSGIPVDDEGLDVEALPRDTRLIYVTPSHQYPLGMSMSLARRLALIDWAERHGAAILEDDYDSEFRFGGRPIEPLHALDTAGRVIYVGSFSKTMLPTLRVGFIVAPPSLRGALEGAKWLTDWASPEATQTALARFIDDGLFARHIRRMRAVYHARHERIVAGLRGRLGEHVEPIPSSVGLHVSALARSASVDDVAHVVKRAAAAGVACMPLAMFAVGASARSGLVLGYGGIDLEDIDEALDRLRAAFEPRPTASRA